MARTWTEEQKKEFAVKMAARRAAKSADPAPTPKTTQQDSITIPMDKFNELMNRLDRLESSKTETIQDKNTGLDQFGKPTGVMQRYSLDPSYYESPVSYLITLPELKRYSMEENYEIDWDVDQTVYETKYGTTMADPQFTIVLKKKIYDNAGQLTPKRMIIQKGVFFEDPAASIKEASALGMDISNANSKEFLSQMRKLRYRQWLLDLFNPSLPSSTAKRRTEQVIDGKVYTIEDHSEEL